MPSSDKSFTAVPDRWLESLMSVKVAPKEFRILLALARWTLGFGMERRELYQGQLASATGMHESRVSRGLTRLVERCMVRRSDPGRTYWLELDPSLWIPPGEPGPVWGAMRKGRVGEEENPGERRKLELAYNAALQGKERLITEDPDAVIEVLVNDLSLPRERASQAVAATLSHHPARPFHYLRSVILGKVSESTTPTKWPDVPAFSLRAMLVRDLERIRQAGLGVVVASCTDLGFLRAWVEFCCTTVTADKGLYAGWDEGAASLLAVRVADKSAAQRHKFYAGE